MQVKSRKIQLLSKWSVRRLWVLILTPMLIAGCSGWKKSNNKTVEASEKSKNVKSTEGYSQDNYKEMNEKKFKIIQETTDITNGIMQYLNENEYEKYPEVKALVDAGNEQLREAEVAKENYKKYAEAENWKDAFIQAEQYWQYQVKALDEGFLRG